MDFVKIRSLQSFGLEGREVRIEALRSRGLSQLSVTGLPDAWLRDSRDKIRAIVVSQQAWGPLERVLVHLMPADENKSGAHLELPIVLACLVVLSGESVEAAALKFLAEHVFVGALSLDGRLEPTPLSDLFERQAPHVIGPGRFSNLGELWNFILAGGRELPELRSMRPQILMLQKERPHVEGRYWERYLLLCAAIAELPVLMVGPPGQGKSHLAAWAHGLLPEVDAATRSEIRQLWSLAGLPAPSRLPLLTPHSRSHLSEFLGHIHKGVARPGFFALAHGGLLILNEFPEMNRDCREILRTVLDEKEVLRNASGRTLRWPANFWLIATANPCPCGFAEGEQRSECKCSTALYFAYQNRFSGPFLDRIGLKLHIGKNKSPSKGRLKAKATWPMPSGLPADFFDRDSTVLSAHVEAMRVRRQDFMAQALKQVAEAPEFAKASEREKQNKARFFSAMLAQNSNEAKALWSLLVSHRLLEESLFGKHQPPSFSDYA